MLIIERMYLYATWIVIAFITGTIILVLLRLIANYTDLNPFTWSALTIRRLTDPLITPVRRALVGFRVDPKYAPLVTILIAILLGWFGLQLLATLANTLAGVLFSAQELAIVAIIGYVLYGLLAVYTLFIFIRIVFAWAMLGYSNRLMRFLVNVTEPLLGPLRRLIPPLGMFDISPIVAFIILWLFQSAIAGTLLRGLRLQFVA